jgi:hypothetical protein
VVDQRATLVTERPFAAKGRVMGSPPEPAEGAETGGTRAARVFGLKSPGPRHKKLGGAPLRSESGPGRITSGARLGAPVILIQGLPNAFNA